MHLPKLRYLHRILRDPHRQEPCSLRELLVPKYASLFFHDPTAKYGVDVRGPAISHMMYIMRSSWAILKALFVLTWVDLMDPWILSRLLWSVNPDRLDMTLDYRHCEPVMDDFSPAVPPLCLTVNVVKGWLETKVGG